MFLKILEDASDQFNTSAHAYCLMPNHLHLLIQTKEANLSNFMKRLLGVYTMRFNRKHKRHGHLFQGRYKAILIDQDSYFLQLSRYIHLNPVKAKMVRLPQDYPWSSIKFFGKSNGPSFLQKDFTLKSFNSAKDYHAFVNEGVNTDDFIPRPIGGCILGSESFIQKFTKQIHANKDREISGKKQFLKPSILKLQALLHRKEKSLQMYCYWKYGCLTQKEIGRIFSRTHAAVSQNIHRFKLRLKEDKTAMQEIAEIQEQLKCHNLRTDPTNLANALESVSGLVHHDL